MGEEFKFTNPIIVCVDCTDEIENSVVLNDSIVSLLFGVEFCYLDFRRKNIGDWWMDPVATERGFDEARSAALAGMNFLAVKQSVNDPAWTDQVQVVVLGQDIEIGLRSVRDMYVSLFSNAAFMAVHNQRIGPRIWDGDFRYSDLSLEESIRHTLIEELELRVRPYNVLKRAHIETIGDLADKSRKELLEVPHLRPEHVKEVVEALKRYNLKLRPHVEVEERFIGVPISELEFSVRTHNLLKREGDITTIDQLLQWSENEIAGIDQAGKKTVQEIIQQLAVHALHLAPDA